ncbi:MAG: hypothetical protein Q4C47_09925, partial [Planctomycetia bacterium]|nr:hypothetical protein [Planctomycetia bacterium]
RGKDESAKTDVSTEPAQLPASAADPINLSVHEYPLERLIPGAYHWIEMTCPDDTPRRMTLQVTTPDTTVLWGVQDHSGNWEMAETRGRHVLRFLFRPSAPTATLSIAVHVDETDRTATDSQNAGTPPYEQIRILAAPEGISLPARTVRSGRRLILADLPDPECPTFAGMTTGPEDWNAILTSGITMTEVLRFARYDGLIRTVRLPTIQRHSAPSPESTEPEIRDTAELWLRLFDREGLMLVLRPEWSLPSEMTFRNPLDAAFQTIVLDQMREIATRYAHHPSFGGVALDLSASGGFRFTAPEEGLDPVTRSDFVRETGFAAKSVDAITGTEPEWLTWRAERVAQFYDQLADTLRRGRSEARIWLTGYDPEESPECRTPLDAGLAAERFAADSRYFNAIPESVVTDGAGMAIGTFPDARRIGMTSPLSVETRESGPLRLRQVGDSSIRDLAKQWAERDIRIFCDAPFQSVFRYEVSPVVAGASGTSVVPVPVPSGTTSGELHADQGDPTRRLRMIFRDFPTLP